MTVAFDKIKAGAVVTRFGETCTRVERLTYDDPAPQWFDPSHNKSHNAIHRHGLSVYFVIRLDLAARASAHPFSTSIAPGAARASQLRLVFSEMPRPQDPSRKAARSRKDRQR